MSARDGLTEALRIHLRTTLDTATALAAHLDSTTRALAHNHAAAIERDLNTTACLLQELEQALARQYAILRQHGHDADAGGLRRAIGDSNDSDLAQLWSSVRTQLLQNRDTNRGNARLADASLRRTRRTLQLLSGNDTPESSAYGKRGTLVSQDAAQSIARA